MYPILILRCELVCLIILIFLFFTSRQYNVDNENKAFSRILYLAIIHVIFDAVTVITVNHTDVVPELVNWICHALFYISAILFSNEVVNYVFAICYPKQAKKLYILGLVLTAIYICCLPFLDIYYVQDVGTYSSAGSAAIVGYCLAFGFFIAAMVIIFTHLDKMSASIKRALIPMMLVLIVTEVCQIIWRSILFTGGAITIVTVGFFFSLENPVEVFKKKALTDALTGVRSRRSYEDDIEQLERQFQKDPGNDFTFVFIDLNDLREVNNRFGHAEGDNYIALIATSINQCMKHAAAVYRIGGDEFLVLYQRTDKDLVEREIIELKNACATASDDLDYTAAIAAGYATSSSSYSSLEDVIKTADYAMYQNKADEKSHSGWHSNSFGTRINYSGLTDKTFDVICASNEKNYPFITNMNTNVTRISHAWKEYFGLESEFYDDFTAVWKERIHPNYLEGYMDDLIAVINGHRKYHNYDYLARKADGEYVSVTCHGSMYRDIISGITYFTGFIANHGLDENTDHVTGLRNFDQLTIGFYKHTDNGLPFSVMRLRVNNFARINMLYGYDEGTEMLKRIAEILKKELGDEGEVFCQNSVNFSILFDTCDRNVLEDYYRRITQKLSEGVAIPSGSVPVLISGGAYTNSGEVIDNKKMRSGLIFAVEESYNSKHRNLVFWPDINDKHSDADISLLTAIHSDALSEQKYFKLRYQPIVDVTSGKVVAAEALLRWVHPGYGEVSPEKFIAFLENDSCYYRLGHGIIEHAIHDAKEFSKKIPGFKINVNITALQLQDEHFVDEIFSILHESNYDPGNLILELTERCKEMDSKFLAARIAELRAKGVKVAFDDLGTGYSTISLLMNIPVDEIKLDREFVRDMRNHGSYQLFVSALVQGKSSEDNSYTICFEGVETKEMLDEIRRFGDFLAQGYYFARPLPKDEFRQYINDH